MILMITSLVGQHLNSAETQARSTVSFIVIVGVTSLRTLNAFYAIARKKRKKRLMSPKSGKRRVSLISIFFFY
jgi:hypothetical protein